MTSLSQTFLPYSNKFLNISAFSKKNPEDIISPRIKKHLERTSSASFKKKFGSAENYDEKIFLSRLQLLHLILLPSILPTQFLRKW